MSQKFSGSELLKALGIKQKMDICLKCGKNKVVSSTHVKIKEGQWENSNLHMFCAECLMGN